MSRISIIIASGFGSGFSPLAPGTAGTLVGFVIAYVLLLLGINDVFILPALAIILTIIGYAAIVKLPKSWIHDDQRIVIDEIIGYIVAVSFVPMNLMFLLVGFVLFRAFDIWKPFGIRHLDKKGGDLSVILDDVLAGIYANITLQLLVLILPNL